MCDSDFKTIGGGVKGVGHVTYFFMRGFLIENKLTVTHKSNMLFLFFFFMRGVTVTHKSKGGGE